MPQSSRARGSSSKRVITDVLGRFLLGGKVKAVQKARCRTRKAHIPRTRDAETSVSSLRRRLLVQDGVHNMIDPDYAEQEPILDQDDSEEGDIETSPSGKIEYYNKNEELEVIREICIATSMGEVQDIMDLKVKDDWLGGLDSFPGNIYMISALNWEHLDKTWRKGMAKRLGMFAVLIIQFLGPPVIFFQAWYGFGLDDHDVIHWNQWSISLSDWSWEEKYYLTKFIALLFLFCFILNGLFVHLDETNSWLKVCKIVNMLNHNGEMSDSCTLFLYIGAFMNSWVIFWLCIDVWLVLGTSDSVTEVLMDAMGLAFLYNLDDVGADLRFVDADDWPGLQLAWVDKNRHAVADEFDDVDQDDTSPPAVCFFFLWGCAFILGAFSFVLPLAFIVTPFKTMKPDPFFETITESMWNATITV